MNEMKARGYHINPIWYNVNWRGNTLGEVDGWAAQKLVDVLVNKKEILYKEHDDKYLQECLENLKSKGVFDGLLLDEEIRLQRLALVSRLQT